MKTQQIVSLTVQKSSNKKWKSIYQRRQKRSIRSYRLEKQKTQLHQFQSPLKRKSRCGTANSRTSGRLASYVAGALHHSSGTWRCPGYGRWCLKTLLLPHRDMTFNVEKTAPTAKQWVTICTHNVKKANDKIKWLCAAFMAVYIHLMKKGKKQVLVRR